MHRFRTLGKLKFTSLLSLYITRNKRTPPDTRMRELGKALFSSNHSVSVGMSRFPMHRRDFQRVAVVEAFMLSKRPPMLECNHYPLSLRLSALVLALERYHRESGVSVRRSRLLNYPMLSGRISGHCRLVA